MVRQYYHIGYAVDCFVVASRIAPTVPPLFNNDFPGFGAIIWQSRHKKIYLINYEDTLSLKSFSE